MVVSYRQVPIDTPLVCKFMVSYYNHPESHPSQYKWPQETEFYLETIVDGIPRYNRDRMN